MFQTGLVGLRGNNMEDNAFTNHLCNQVDAACKNIMDEYKRVVRLNIQLQKENTALKSEYYKDEELANMKKKLDKIFRNNDFILTDKASEIKNKFMEEHCKNCSDYKRSDSVEYIYTSTHIVSMVELKCSCGKKVELMII